MCLNNVINVFGLVNMVVFDELKVVSECKVFFDV